jgi:hypothetical protein
MTYRYSSRVPQRLARLLLQATGPVNVETVINRLAHRWDLLLSARRREENHNAPAPAQLKSLPTLSRLR